MKYTRFKGEDISRLGFGLMRLPVIDDDQSKVDRKKVEEMVLYAYEHGINYFDTAFPYHNGFSEKTFGQILTDNGLHGKVNVATKLFTLGIDAPDFSPQAMFDEQLNRLQTDCIEFYLMHGLHGSQWKTLCEKHDIKNWIAGLKAQGKIKHVGFSFHDDYDKFVEIIDDFDWDFAQIQYNYLDNELQAGDKGVAYANGKGIPLNVMEPLKGGSIIFPDYPEVDAIKEKYGIGNISNAELGISYVMNNPAFMVVLSGMSNMEQVEDNVRTFSTDKPGLTEVDKLLLGKACEMFREYIHIPCTACRYCTADCPQQINIPEFISVYNKFKVNGTWGIKSDLASITTEGKPADCIQCGACMGHCPQSIQIPDIMGKIVEMEQSL